MSEHQEKIGLREWAFAMLVALIVFCITLDILAWRPVHLVPALAVAFPAFCVWLTVRIINRRERWAKWTLSVMVGLPLLYVLSIGPAVRMLSWHGEPQWAANLYKRIYAPITEVHKHGPQLVRDVLDRYMDLWLS